MGRNNNRETTFRFKEFDVVNKLSAMKVGTDAVLLGALTPLPANDFCNVLDIGTGTGVISLLLAQRIPGASVHAIEIDSDAVAEAQYNFTRSPYSSRLVVEQCDIADYDRNIGTWDLIVCNPPYFTESLHAPALNRAIARHQDSMPLSLLINKFVKLLSPDGVAAIILPANQDSEIEYYAALNQLNIKCRTHISTVEGKSPTRTVTVMCKNDCVTTVNHIILRDKSNQPTDTYRKLVTPYYLTVK